MTDPEKQQYRFVGNQPCECDCGCGRVSDYYVWRWLVPATEKTVAYYEVAGTLAEDFWAGTSRFNYHMEHV